MGALHGPVVNGVIQVNQRIRFTNQVQAGLNNPWSDEWFVDGDNGNTAYNGRGPSQSKALLSQAIAAASDNDVIKMKAADYTESAGITLSLNDVTIIGHAPTLFQPHLDVWMTAAGGGFSPQITVSGRGNAFYNLCFRHGAEYTSGVGYATDLTCMKVSGRYNYFENVYFYSPIYPEQDVANTNVGANDGYYGVEISGHNNYFKYCKFGSDGMLRDQLNFNLLLHGGIGNVFEKCFFQMGADGATPLFIGVDSVPRDMKYSLFRECTFYVHSGNYGTTIGDALAVQAGGNTAGIVLERCNFVNVGNVSDTSNDDWVWKENIKGEFGADTVKISSIALRSQGA